MTTTVANPTDTDGAPSTATATAPINALTTSSKKGTVNPTTRGIGMIIRRLKKKKSKKGGNGRSSSSGGGGLPPLGSGGGWKGKLLGRGRRGGKRSKGAAKAAVPPPAVSSPEGRDDDDEVYEESRFDVDVRDKLLAVLLTKDAAVNNDNEEIISGDEGSKDNCDLYSKGGSSIVSEDMRTYSSRFTYEYDDRTYDKTVECEEGGGGMRFRCHPSVPDAFQNIEVPIRCHPGVPDAFRNSNRVVIDAVKQAPFQCHRGGLDARENFTSALDAVAKRVPSPFPRDVVDDDDNAEGKREECDGGANAGEDAEGRYDLDDVAGGRGGWFSHCAVGDALSTTAATMFDRVKNCNAAAAENTNEEEEDIEKTKDGSKQFVEAESEERNARDDASPRASAPAGDPPADTTLLDTLLTHSASIKKTLTGATPKHSNRTSKDFTEDDVDDDDRIDGIIMRDLTIGTDHFAVEVERERDAVSEYSGEGKGVEEDDADGGDDDAETHDDDEKGGDGEEADAGDGRENNARNIPEDDPTTAALAAAERAILVAVEEIRRKRSASHSPPGSPPGSAPKTENHPSTTISPFDDPEIKLNEQSFHIEEGADDDGTGDTKQEISEDVTSARMDDKIDGIALGEGTLA